MKGTDKPQGEILDKCCELLSACVNKNVRVTLDSLLNRVRINIMLRDIKSSKYKSHYWQLLKREAAEAIADCIINLKDFCMSDGIIKEIYIADLTGGEHSYIAQGYGGKDLDVIIYVEGLLSRNEKKKIENSIESCIENTINIILNELFSDDPKKLLGVPNLVEIHMVSGKEDIPYYNMIKSRSRSLIKLRGFHNDAL